MKTLQLVPLKFSFCLRLILLILLAYGFVIESTPQTILVSDVFRGSSEFLQTNSAT